jgi:hypothetical protein
LADDRVEDVLVVGNAIYLAGRFLNLRPPGTDPGDPSEEPRRWFGACDLVTGAVLPWNPEVDCLAPSNCTTARGQTLALAPGGDAIYLGGRFTHVGDAERRHAARVTLATAEAQAWNPAPTDRVQRVVVAPDQARVYVAGSFAAIGGCSPSPCHARLAATDPVTGALVVSFHPAIASDEGFATVHTLDFSPDGQTIFFGGQFDSVNGEGRNSAAAVDAATGQTTTAFAPEIADANPVDLHVQIYDLLVHDGHVYLCGDWWATEGIGVKEDQRNINRFDVSDGAVDFGFWVSTDGGVQACAIDPNAGLLFVGGHFDCVREWIDSETPVDPAPAPCGGDGLLGTQQRDLFALTLDDGALVAWNPDPSGVNGTWALTVAGGRVIAGGQLGWPRLGTATHQNLLVFDRRLFADGFETGDTSRWSLTVP